MTPKVPDPGHAAAFAQLALVPAALDSDQDAQGQGNAQTLEDLDL